MHVQARESALLYGIRQWGGIKANLRGRTCVRVRLYACGCERVQCAWKERVGGKKRESEKVSDVANPIVVAGTQNFQRATFTWIKGEKKMGKGRLREKGSGEVQITREGVIERGRARN